MSKELSYLQRVIRHEDWHINQQKSKQEDYSCNKCFPVDIQQISNEFEEFWKYWTQPRCSGSQFNSNTVETFERLQKCTDQQVEGLILYLIKTIRYSAIPNFTLLVESLQFYWEVTNKFNNWEAYYSDNSSDVSTVTSSTSNLTFEMSQTKQQKVVQQHNSPHQSDVEDEDNTNPPQQTQDENEAWGKQDQSYSHLNIGDVSNYPLHPTPDNKQSALLGGTGYRFGEEPDNQTIRAETPSSVKKTVGFISDIAKKNKYTLSSQSTGKSGGSKSSKNAKQSGSGTNTTPKRSSTPYYNPYTSTPSGSKISRLIDHGDDDGDDSDDSGDGSDYNSGDILGGFGNPKKGKKKEKSKIPMKENGKIDEEKLVPMLMEKMFEFFERGSQTKETRLVDFPEFKGGNQDPVEWLESFERACTANRVPEDR
jgi:hypothetical protein